MVKSSIFKLCTTKYKIYNNIYIHNLGYVEALSEYAINKNSVNTIVCIPDLVIKYFGNNTGEIKRIVFTYADLLPSVFVVDLGLIHLCRSVGIHLLWKICDVRTVSMASWNRGFFFASVLFRYESTIILICLYEELFVAYQQ